MPLVNFNDTTPAAPTGGVNVKFLSDASSNMSAYVPAGTYMPPVTFSNTTPAPPAGKVNVTFQSDASGNISAYDPGGSWQTWTPTLSADVGTFTLGSLYLNVYIQSGPTVYFQLRFSATTSSASAAYLFFTLPVTDVTPNNFAALPPAIAESVPAALTQWDLMPTRILNPGKVVIQLKANANWPVGSYTFAVSGFYRSA
jgi:hypothetical protein